MKKRTWIGKCMAALGVIALVVAWSGTGLAENSDTHDVSITVSEVAELAIVETATAAVTIGSPDTPGDAPKETWTNNDGSYLQYTSVVSGSSTNKITVATASTLPTGVTLKVTPNAAGANKKGDVGDVSGSAVTISSTAADLVTGIGTGWTGTATSDGAKIVYSVELDPSTLVTTTVTDITVTYTLTATAV